MSRTDHHRPWAIHAADLKRHPAYMWHYACNEGPTGVCHENCGWTFSHYQMIHPPRWFVRHVWTGPERVRERDQLARLANEYNTYGDLDDGDFGCWQHRHNARWTWA